MKEFRCKFCHRLLAKVECEGLVEIKCPKCKTLNLLNTNVITIVKVDEPNTEKSVRDGKVIHDIVDN